MASSYIPTTVNQGFGAEVTINDNLDRIKIALDEMLSRSDSTDNVYEQSLDMGNQQIINLPDATVALDPVLLKQLNSLAIVEVVQAIPFAATIEIDLDQVTFAKIILTGDTTISFTGTPNDGQPILISLQQDATGSRLVTWEARARFSTDVPEPVLTTTALKLDYVVFRFNADSSNFDLMAVNRGF